MTETEPIPVEEADTGMADMLGGLAATAFGGVGLIKEVFFSPKTVEDLSVIDTLLPVASWGGLLAGGVYFIGRGLKHCRQFQQQNSETTPSSE